MFESNGGRASGAASRLVSARLAIAAATTVASIGSSAFATEYVRSATLGNLNVPASWDGVNVPGAGDTAAWDTGSIATPNALGADTSWLGIRIGAGEASAVSISGANVLTLGSGGIDMSAAVANLTIQPTPSTTTGIALGAAQTWSVNAGRLLSVANGSGAITGGAGATLTKTGAGTTLFNTALSTFAGGVTITQGAVTFNSNTTTTASAVASGPLGTGTITLNGGTLSVSTTSGRDLSNNVSVTADSTIGLAATNRVRSAGAWDLGGATRTLTLTNVGTAVGTGEQFAFIAQGTAPANKVFTLLNGNLRFVGGATSSAGTPAQINFAQGSGGVNFGNNGVTIGQNVLAAEGSSQTMTAGNSPRLTLEGNGVLIMGSATQAKSFTAYSLAGSGTVASFSSDALAAASTLTLDGSAGTTTFTGEIRNALGYAVYGVTGSTLPVTVGVTKNGGSTQILSGTNTYTGGTTVSGGTLATNSVKAVAGGAVNVTTNATLAVNSGAVSGLEVSTLTLDATATVDVKTSAVVVRNGTFSTLRTSVVNAFVNGGNYDWGGKGITSAAAAARSQVDGATGVGIVSNDNLGYTSFKGVTGLAGTANEVLIKYTYLGDTDLDGDVDGGDFTALIAGISAGTGGWELGDTDYNGIVNSGDFVGFVTGLSAYQGGGPLLLSHAQLDGLYAQLQAGTLTFAQLSAAVPEPTSFAALAGVAGVLVRRRRR